VAFAIPRTIRRAAFHSRVARLPLVRYRHRGLRDDDAMIVGYTRSGSTWLRFLLGEALTGRELDFDPAAHPVQYVGRHRGTPGILPNGGRLIYSHETLDVGVRPIVYVVRDPRAVAASEYRWLVRRGLEPGDRDLDAFVRAFVAGRSNPWGSWADHVARWRGSPSARAGRLRLVTFEDLRADTVAVTRDLLRFLGADLPVDVVRSVVEHNSVERLRAKERVAPASAFAKGVRRDVPYVRAGAVAGWRGELADAHVAAIERAFGPTMVSLGYEPATAAS
jgi:hypothetical protein